MSSTTHYRDVAQKYEDAFFYNNPNYLAWLVDMIAPVLAASSTPANGTAAPLLLDLGGGTGNFTQALATRLRASSKGGAWRRALCVDNSLDMLQQVVAHKDVEPMLLDATAFSRLPTTPPSLPPHYRILLKEVIHHIPTHEYAGMFAGLAQRMALGGVVLVVTRPQVVDYPLFDLAREVWYANQPPAEEIAAAMREAGLQVTMHTHCYKASVPVNAWINMVNNRFWSTFAAMTDAQLSEGVGQLREQAHGRSTFDFEDRLVFILGEKQKGGGVQQTTAGVHDKNQSTAGVHDKSNGKACMPPVSAAGLTVDQQQHYCTQGFVGPIDVLTEAQAGEALEALDRYTAAVHVIESDQGTSDGHRTRSLVNGGWRFKSHVLLPWVWGLVHHPRIVAAVQDALQCSNVMCWSTDWFIKDQGGFVSWHQDSTYTAFDPPGHVLTAWLALTPSTPTNGCVRFAPASHLHGQQPHTQHPSADNMLLYGQTVDTATSLGQPCPEDGRPCPEDGQPCTEDGQPCTQGVAMELRPGQLSLHNALTVHCSHAAQAGEGRRVGLALGYKACHVVQGLAQADMVCVVAGHDTFGRHQHETPPAGEMDEGGLVLHAKSVARVDQQ